MRRHIIGSIKLKCEEKLKLKTVFWCNFWLMEAEIAAD